MYQVEYRCMKYPGPWINQNISSSPELKAQVSFSDCLSSVIHLYVRMSACPHVCKLFTFSSSPEPLGQFQPNFAQSYLVKGIQICSNEGSCPFSRGDNYEIVKIRTLTNLKNHLLQNHWADFNQTWHKSSFGVGDSSFFQMKGPALFPGELITKLRKYIDKV